jgi:hypothetical protein
VTGRTWPDLKVNQLIRRGVRLSGSVAAELVVRLGLGLGAGVVTALIGSPRVCSPKFPT